MSSTSPVAEQEMEHRRVVMLVLATAIFAGAASMRILDALLPEIARYYGQSVGTAGLAVTAYAISYSSCQLLYGPLGDRLGPYRIVAIAALLSGAAALGCAIAPSFDWLVALRLLAGGIAAGIGPLAMTWVSHATDARERPVAVARMTGASIIGTTAGQIGGGLIGAVLSWQASFVLIGLLFAASGGAMLRTAALYPHVRSVGRRAPLEPGERRIGLLDLVRRRRVLAVLAGVGCEGLAMYMSFTYVSALLHARLAIGIGTIGLLVACFGLGGITFVLIAHHLVRRLTESDRAVLGGCLLGTAYLLLMVVRAAPVAAVALFLLGLGFFMLHNILQVRATHMAPDAPGAGVSLFAATFFLAQALGATIGGWSFDHLGASVSCGASAALLHALGLALGRIVRRTPA